MNMYLFDYRCSFGAQVPTQQSLGLNNRGLLMIGRCWPQLRVLCAGGADVSVKGLVAVGRWIQCNTISDESGNTALCCLWV